MAIGQGSCPVGIPALPPFLQFGCIEHPLLAESSLFRPCDQAPSLEFREHPPQIEGHPPPDPASRPRSRPPRPGSHERKPSRGGTPPRVVAARHLDSKCARRRNFSGYKGGVAIVGYTSWVRPFEGPYRSRPGSRNDPGSAWRPGAGGDICAAFECRVLVSARRLVREEGGSGSRGEA